jgi:iron(III) transport system ATP-binding protein
MNTDPIRSIRCRNLCKHYQGTPAACGVDLEVTEGRFLALLGPSGCGKTTVLRMIAGFEIPDRGDVEIGGRTVVAPAIFVPPEKRRVGMVFQEYALFPHLTVGQNVAYGCNGNGSLRVQEVLQAVGLEGLSDRYPHELSGGQQQRVALARALAPNPACILLDEPFSNLDAALRTRVRQEVRQILRQAGVTAIFVTHDQEEALSLADEVAVMIDGKIVQCARPERLYRRPATHRVATFLGDANFLPGQADGDRVACALGQLPLIESAHGEVEIMIRPEDVLLTIDDQGPGRIVERTYFGHDQLLRIELPDHTLIRARMVGCCRGMQEGVRVRLEIDNPVISYPTRYGCPIDPQPRALAESAL